MESIPIKIDNITIDGYLVPQTYNIDMSRERIVILVTATKFPYKTQKIGN